MPMLVRAFAPILAFAAVLAFAPASPARDLYVDNVGGDDIRDGATPSINEQGGGPLQSINRALELAQKGDRIILADTGEPYRESICLTGGRHSGFPSQPFEIVGNGAVLDGSQPVPDDAWQHFRGELFRFRPKLLSHQQLFHDGLPLARRAVERDYEVPPLEPLEWCLMDGYVFFRPEENRLPQSYGLHYAGSRVGITLYEVRHVSISDLVVQGFQLDGVSAPDNAFEVALIGLTARGNGRSGISVSGASRVLIQACLVGNNGAAQIRTEGPSHTRIVNCDLVDSPDAPALIREGREVIVENAPSP